MTCENCWQRQWDFFRFAAAPAVKQSKSIVRCDLSKKKKMHISPKSHKQWFTFDLRKGSICFNTELFNELHLLFFQGICCKSRTHKIRRKFEEKSSWVGLFFGGFLGLFQNPEHILQYYEWFVLQIMAGLYTLSLLTFEMYVFLLSYENIIHIYIYIYK